MSKGYRSVKIKGIEGEVQFNLERYKSGGDYFQKSHQFESGLESKLLSEYIKEEVNYKSYARVSKSIEIITGTRLYSSNHLSEKVKQYAQEVTQERISRYDGIQLSIPFAEASVDIYESTGKEILLFDDAIGVKRQKEKRQKDYKKTIKTVQTDVIEVQTPQGGYEYVTAGYGVKDWDIEMALRCWFCFHYGGQLLPIVAITDGASKIRERLWRISGRQVVIILDWFHLHKKCRELLSMIAWHKKQKEEILAYIMPLLWEGKTNEVVNHLKTIQARNQEKKKSLSLIYKSINAKSSTIKDEKKLINLLALAGLKKAWIWS